MRLAFNSNKYELVKSCKNREPVLKKQQSKIGFLELTNKLQDF